MKTFGKVVELYISKEKYDGRISQSELAVDEDGVFVDKFYGKDKVRSILIASTEAYELIRTNGIEITHGELGENILVDFDLDLFKVGMQFQIDNVVLEITQNCTICDHLSKIDERVPSLLENDRGVFAKVLSKGIIYTKSDLQCIKNCNG